MADPGRRARGTAPDYRPAAAESNRVRSRADRFRNSFSRRNLSVIGRFRTEKSLSLDRVRSRPTILAENRYATGRFASAPHPGPTRPLSKGTSMADPLSTEIAAPERISTGIPGLDDV